MGGHTVPAVRFEAHVRLQGQGRSGIALCPLLPPLGEVLRHGLPQPGTLTTP